MNREIHVRFCEGMRVKFPCATRPLEEHKEEHFQALKIPLDVELFISKIKDLMKDSLSILNQGFEEKSNQKVSITTKNNKGWIKVTPLEKQEEPQHLVHIKNHIKKRWSRY